MSLLSRSNGSISCSYADNCRTPYIRAMVAAPPFVCDL